MNSSFVSLSTLFLPIPQPKQPMAPVALCPSAVHAPYVSQSSPLRPMCNGWTCFFVSRSLLASKLLAAGTASPRRQKLEHSKRRTTVLYGPPSGPCNGWSSAVTLRIVLFIFLLCFIDLSLTVLAYDVVSTPYFFLYLCMLS